MQVFFIVYVKVSTPKCCLFTLLSEVCHIMLVGHSLALMYACSIYMLADILSSKSNSSIAIVVGYGERAKVIPALYIEDREYKAMAIILATSYWCCVKKHKHW